VLRAHLERFWGPAARQETLAGQPASGDPTDVSVLVFPPRAGRALWTYASADFSAKDDTAPIELHLFSPVETSAHVELLTVCSHYHQRGARLGLHHTVNFGRPWLPGSRCDYGLISLPYLDGPTLEQAEIGGRPVQCLWLVPITLHEREYKKKHGVEALESLFQRAKMQCADLDRASVVE